MPIITTPLVNNALAKEFTPSDRIIHVKTDVLNVSIDRQGGNILKVSLPAYPKTLHSKESFILLNDKPDNLYVAQSGLISNSGPDSLHQQAVYTSAAMDYQLAQNQNELTVNLQWKNANGVTIHKNFTFKKGQYDIGVSYTIENNGLQAWTGYLYSQLVRKNVPQENKGMFQVNPYIGSIISSPEKRYEKIDFDKMIKQDFNQDIKNGWAAILQHYFLSVWIPDNQQTFNYTTKALPQDLFLVRLVGTLFSVEPSKTKQIKTTFYAGPAIADSLKNLAPGLDLTVDYGILWPIGIVIFWFMKNIHNLFGNWGVSIILVTLLIKLAFYKLSAASYKSMASMRKLQPKLAALKERYGEDRQKLSQATMELYRKEKVNPLGGCLPVLIQIPVFIALYWVLIESVQLRQAPFMLWINDLSAPDPFYVLPIIMGITIFLQQKMNPTPMDPIQAKVMMVLPIFFTVLFLNFPSGLVLYWVVNNVLSIIQQWYITHSLEKKDALPRLSHKKSN
ncbi:MAG: Membrane protein insertase YidC [Legionellaceae bacterium]